MKKIITCLILMIFLVFVIGCTQQKTYAQRNVPMQTTTQSGAQPSAEQVAEQTGTGSVKEVDALNSDLDTNNEGMGTLENDLENFEI